MYGPRGFLQYQLVVPVRGRGVPARGVERLQRGARRLVPAVLKRFGPERGLLSFPIAGWTLPLDVPAGAPGLAALLDGLDELVAGAGGRVYLSKDSRLRPDAAGPPCTRGWASGARCASGWTPSGACARTWPGAWSWPGR